MNTESILAPVAALTLPDSAQLTTRAQTALAFIEGMQVNSIEAYGFAADELMAIKTKAKKIEAQRTAITVPHNGVLKAVNDLFRGPAELLDRAEKLLKGKMLTWDQEQERIAAEARRKAEAEAAAARKKLEEEAAARQAEADAQAEIARKAAAAGDEQAAQLAQAAADRANAEAQESAITAQLVVAAPPAIVKTSVAGISTSKKVDFEVVDLHALVKHIAANPELLALVVADSVKLRAYVKAMGTACQLPGVRVFESSVLSARAA